MVQLESLSENRRCAKRTRGGRAARHRLREGGTAAKAIGPGLKGGSFKPLGNRDIERIHQTVLDV